MPHTNVVTLHGTSGRSESSVAKTMAESKGPAACLLHAALNHLVNDVGWLAALGCLIPQHLLLSCKPAPQQVSAVMSCCEALFAQL